MSGVTHNMPMPLVRRTTMTLQAALDGAVGSESNDQRASMGESALLLVLVLLVAFFTVQIFGDSLVGLFDASANTVDSAPDVGPEG